ncbi:uncharacterized protein C1orf112 homolog isoform X2 [Onychomys torridus]|uniref:uncharacterized protein C1orf112 homolog isoform X2 n=1 Tax=Onychomys torridus TaxID=38674 RepID=UPI00167F87AD|nr:uncharacterized protein C1orf112 homolog isoform X2 [Onychomys torridus]
MSQDDDVEANRVVLEKFSSWSREECRRELPSALPRLLSIYQHSESWIEHIRILKIITDMFLPHVNHLTLEQSVFSQILPKTIKLFDGMIDELTTQATELSSQNLEIQVTLRNILQTMAQILGGLTGFVHHVCTTQEFVILENIHSLPSSILHIIKKTFVHCKNSESLYSGRLHLLSDLLQGLFREAYSLQKKLMGLLDMVCMDPSVDENNILLMVEVIHSLLDVCSVISTMDQAFHANTWKFIIKQSLKHQSVIKSQLKHKEIISSLCEDIVFSFHSCLQLAEQMVQPAAQDNADYRIYQKTLKLCRFFANSLLHYTKEFLPFLSESCCILHQLYLQIYSKFPPNLCAARISKAQQEEIAGTFLVVLDPLIGQLITSQSFVQAVLDSKLDLPCELQLSHVLLLIVVVDKLPSQPKDVQTLWCSTEAMARVSLIKAIFYSLERCSGELSLTAPLPGVKDNRQAEVSVTLYQHACVHLCAFVASFHTSLFPELDAALLNAVLSVNMTTSLLAMDVWCFLARYGTAELCMHHVTLVAHLIKSCPGECIQLTNLTLLLRRLFFFMSPPHQVEFIRRFSPKEADNLPLWQCISFQSLSADLRKQAACEVIRVCTAQCIKWLSSSHTLAELDYLNTALSALLTVCNSAGDALDIRQQTTVIEVVISQPYVQQAFSLLLQLLAFFIQTVDPQLISQVVTLLTSLLKLEPPDHVSLAALDFISSLGRLFIPQAIQDKVLPNLSCIFALLLANKNWLLEQHTLEAFTQFAEGTNHEDIVPQCLNSEEIKNKVVAFLEKTGLVDETEAAIVDHAKKKKGTFWEPAAKVTGGEANGLALQPCTKRARHELPFEEEYRLAFQAAAGALETTEMLLQQAPAPDWLVVELEALQEKIEKLKCCVPEGI